MAFALRVLDSNGYTIIEHVSMESDDPIYVPDWKDLGLNQPEYRKTRHLINEISNGMADWKVETKEFDISSTIFPIL